MKAMILAAGLGTRLRPLTDHRPKALVEIAGRTLLEITLSRLRAFGIREVIINVHHFADMILEYLKTNDNFGMRIEVSREEVLLDTGGGLKKAAWFFLEDTCSKSRSSCTMWMSSAPSISGAWCNFMLTIRLWPRWRCKTGKLHDTCSSMSSFSSAAGGPTDDQKPELVSSSPRAQALAFCGIHVISPRLLAMMNEDGVFSIIPSYLRLASQGERIVAFRADEYYWRDLGKPENLVQAARDLQQKVLL